MNHWRADLETDWGTFALTFSPRGLSTLSFPGAPIGPGASPRPEVPRWQPGRGGSVDPIGRWMELAAEALRRCLEGQNAEGLLPPLAPEPAGTPFQQVVWLRLRAIERGQVLTYGDVARAVGRPGAARAVGQACGANPLPLFVPCHRVLGAGGKLGGFTAGLEWKRRLLAREGVRV